MSASFVRGLFFAMRQYSSLCVSAVVLTLGGDDIEDGVPDREQVDCERVRVEEGEKQERDKHEDTTNERSNTEHHGWHVDGTNAHHRHLEPRCECKHMCKVHEKTHVRGVSVYTPRRSQWIAIDCKRNQLKQKEDQLNNSYELFANSIQTCPTTMCLKSDAIDCFVLDG